MPLTWPQFLKLVASQRRPAPAREDHGDAETPHAEAYFQNLHLAATHPSAPRKRARTRKMRARFREESDRDQGEPERLLPPHEIVRSLQFYTSPELRRQRRVLISVLAHMSNLSRMTIYRIRRGYPLTRRAQTVLTRTISFIEHQQMEWRRLGNEWEAHQKRPNTYDPLSPMPTAPYLKTAADYKVFPHRIGGITFNIVHGQ
jgi:hypothetical protein